MVPPSTDVVASTFGVGYHPVWPFEEEPKSLPILVSEHAALHYPSLCWIPNREPDMLSGPMAPNVAGIVEGTASLKSGHTVYMGRTWVLRWLLPAASSLEAQQLKKIRLALSNPNLM